MIQAMLGYTPIVVLLLLVFLSTSPHDEVRVEQRIFRVILWSLSIVVVTEGLSAFSMLAPEFIRIYWASFAAILVYLIVAKHQAFSVELTRGETPDTEATPDNKARPSNAWRAVRLLVAVLLLVNLLLVLLTAPSNYDSMTYHLARVENWIAQESIAHYSTSIIRQLQFAPFSEWLFLHSMALSGTDHAVKIYQFLSYVGSAWLMGEIARLMGARPRTRLLVRVIALTIPMAVLQSSSTQNDLIVAFYLVAATYMFILMDIRGVTPGRAFTFGAACALAILTKGTAFIYGLGLAVLFVRVIVRGNRGSWLGVGLVSVLLIGLLNGPHFLRNAQVFAGSGEKQTETIVDQVSWQGVVSNLVRDTGSLLYSPLTVANKQIESSVRQVHAGIGVDASDPRFTFPDTAWGFLYKDETRPVSVAGLGEATAGYGWHLVLYVACFVFIVIRWKSVSPGVRAYLVAGLVPVVAFVVLLKWQPWITRLMLPGAILAALLPAMLSEGFSRSMHARALFGIALLLMSLPFAIGNPQRPLVTPPGYKGFGVFDFEVDRHTAAFGRRPFFFKIRAGVEELVRDGGGHYGLVISDDSWEYPVWQVARQVTRRPVRFTHLCPEQRGGVRVGDPALPVRVISFDVELGQTFECRGAKYEVRWQQDGVSILSQVLPTSQSQ